MYSYSAVYCEKPLNYPLKKTQSYHIWNGNIPNCPLYIWKAVWKSSIVEKVQLQWLLPPLFAFNVPLLTNERHCHCYVAAMAIKEKSSRCRASRTTHVLLLASTCWQKSSLCIRLSVLTLECMACMTCHVFRISIGDNRAGVRHVACALLHLRPSLPFNRRTVQSTAWIFLFIYKSVECWHTV